MILMRILVTGGAGSIGSHTVLVLVADNFCNSEEAAVNPMRGVSDWAVNPNGF